MKILDSILGFCAASSLAAFAQPALTIYNQDFAVVRDTVPLDLKSGVNNVRYADVTARVEPDSVILRDRPASIRSRSGNRITATTRDAGTAAVAVRGQDD